MTTRTRAQKEKEENKNYIIMSRINPQELSLPLPTEGGLWVKQYQHQQQNHHQYQRQPSPDPAQPDSQEDHDDQHCRPLPQQPSAKNTDLFIFVSPNLNSSSSDLASPLTPTFSHHGGSHLRYASSTSSLDLQQSFSSTCSDAPVSPAQPPQNIQNPRSASPAAVSSTKRPLPNVQEDPLERDDAAGSTMTSLTDDQLENLYDCLCMSPSLPCSIYSFGAPRFSGYV